MTSCEPTSIFSILIYQKDTTMIISLISRIRFRSFLTQVSDGLPHSDRTFWLHDVGTELFTTESSATFHRLTPRLRCIDDVFPWWLSSGRNTKLKQNPWCLAKKSLDCPQSFMLWLALLQLVHGWQAIVLWPLTAVVFAWAVTIPLGAAFSILKSWLLACGSSIIRLSRSLLSPSTEEK